MDKKKLLMLLGDLGILSVAFIWGSNNVILRGAIRYIPPFWFCALRFMFGFAVIFALFGKRALKAPKNVKKHGLLIGSVFNCAYLASAVALKYVTAGNQSFMVSTSVVFVLVSVWILSGKFPGWYVVISVVLCVIGMAGMMLDEALTFNFGSIFSLSTTLLVTAYILLVKKFTVRADPFALSCWQALGGAVLATVVASIFEPFPTNVPTEVWLAVLYTASIGFALPLIIQTTAQRYTPATHTAILLSTSGVFGRFLGITVLGEPMTLRIMAASALVLTGVIIAETVPALRAKSAE